INELVIDLKAANVWNKLDIISVPGPDAPTTRRNLKNPAQQATGVNNPPHTAYKGIGNSASNNRMEWGAKTSILTQAQQNNHTFADWVSDDGLDANKYVLGGGTALTHAIGCRPFATINGSGTGQSAAVATSKGLSGMRRDNSATYWASKNLADGT